MATDPTFVIRVLENRGCLLRLEGDRIIARMMFGGPIPNDLARVIRNYRAILVEELSRCQPVQGLAHQINKGREAA